jgi:hypothetical protein
MQGIRMIFNNLEKKYLRNFLRDRIFHWREREDHPHAVEELRLIAAITTKFDTTAPDEVLMEIDGVECAVCEPAANKINALQREVAQLRAQMEK